MNKKLSTEMLINAANSSATKTNLMQAPPKKYNGVYKNLEDYTDAVQLRKLDKRWRQFFDAHDMKKKYGTYSNFIRKAISEKMESVGFTDDFYIEDNK